MPIEPNDTEQQGEDEHDEEENPYPPAAAETRDIAELEIDVREDPFQISALIKKIDHPSKQLILMPDFQRNEVWDLARRSAFIESILLNYPLPPLYLNQDRTGRYIVVDGLQRTSSVYRFMKDEFALTGLRRLHWLNGQKFSELEPILQSRIEDRKLNCYVLRPSVPLAVVHDIFARINQNGMPLERQEIRHGLHQGKSTRLLRRLAKIEPFAEWIGRLLNPKRMGDEEAALRCIGFARVDPESDYRGDMDKFLETIMVQLNGASDDQIAEIEETFAATFLIARAVFGDDAFRIPTPKTRGRINIALMESVYRFIGSHSGEWLGDNSQQLVANYNKLVTTPEFLNAIRSSTSDISKVRARFDLARQILGAGCAD